MKTCPQCGTGFNANERLCPHDGAVLEPDQPAELKHIGKVLDSKYRLDSYLSRGGMGAVYRATHVMLGRAVAVKLINPDLVTSPDVVRRFQREARAITHLNHPNIVEVYDLGQTADGTLYIAMELVAGDSLAAVIKSSGAMPASRIVRIMSQVVSALALAHRKEIVHRDLKPHNIMISHGEDGTEIAKLLDFGIAKTFEVDANTQLTATGSTMGTPKYMSPEQAMGIAVDARSDLYSLGIILYEMLIGEVPFNDPSMPAMLVKHMNEVPVAPSRRRPDLQISPALEAIAMRCLEKDPAQRFQTASELGAELHGVPIDDAAAAVPTAPFAGAAIAVSQTLTPTVVNRPPEAGTRPTAVAAQAPPPTPPVAPPQPRSRSPLVPIAAIVLLLGLMGGGYWAMTRRNEPVPPPVDASPAPVATPAGAEPPKPEPPKPEPPATATATPSTAPSVDPSAPARAATTLPPAEAAGSLASSPPSRATSAKAKSSAPATVRSEPGGAAQIPPPVPAPPRTNPIPATPSVSFDCTGPSEVCAPLRQAIQETAEREGLVITRRTNKAVDVVLTAEVAIVDETQQRQFGTTFFVRTYSIEISGESPRFSQDVPMPASKTFSADTRTGRERLAENARLAASDAIERVQQFWQKRVR